MPNRTNTHILRQVKPYSKEYDEELSLEVVTNWLVDTFCRNECSRPSGYSHRKTACCCVMFLQGEEGEDEPHPVVRNVAEYLLHWAKLNYSQKKHQLNEWFKVSSYLE